MKKTFFVIILVLMILNNSLIVAYQINGNNLIWSPVDQNKFLYANYGKKSGNLIWRIYNLSNKNEDTVYYGNSAQPQWLSNGKGVVFTKQKSFLIYDIDQIEIDSMVDNIVNFDISTKSDKIAYTDGSKIYLLNLINNSNSFVVNGHDPLFINNDKQILFFDEDLHVKTVNNTGKVKEIVPDMVNKLVPLFKENKFVYLDKRAIKLYDIDDQLKYPIVEEQFDVLSFNISQDSQFLTYNNANGEHYLVHIPTKYKSKILSDKDYFLQKVSYINKYCAFEKDNTVMINDIEDYVKAFDLKNIFKISLGFKDEINPGINLEVYEEKKNEFTEKMIGYDPEIFKGVVKIISVFKKYSYGVLEKDISTDKAIEPGDAVLWKEKNIVGQVE